MDSFQIVGLISIVMMIVLMAPVAFRADAGRGTTLRNIAIWLAIFTGLLLLYKLSA